MIGPAQEHLGRQIPALFPTQRASDHDGLKWELLRPGGYITAAPLAGHNEPFAIGRPLEHGDSLGEQETKVTPRRNVGRRGWNRQATGFSLPIEASWTALLILESRSSTYRTIHAPARASIFVPRILRPTGGLSCIQASRPIRLMRGQMPCRWKAAEGKGGKFAR